MLTRALFLLALTGCLANIDDSRADKAPAGGGDPASPVAPGATTTTPPGTSSSPGTGTSPGGGTNPNTNGGGGTTTPTTTSTAASDTHLVGYWSFDSVANLLVADASGKGHTGTVTNNQLVTGKKGNGYDCGNAMSFSVTTLNNLNFPVSGTLSFHAMPRASAAYGAIFASNDDTRNHFGLPAATVAQGKPSLFVCTDDGNVKANLMNQGKSAAPWQWIVVTWGGGSCSLYVDGSRQNQTPCGRFDEQDFFFCNNFEGVIDEIALYDAAFAPDSIPSTR